MGNTLILPHKIVYQSPHCSGKSVEDNNSKKRGRETYLVLRAQVAERVFAHFSAVRDSM